MSDEDFIHEVNIPGYFGDIFDWTYVYNFAADMPEQLAEVASVHRGFRLTRPFECVLLIMK